MRSRDWSRNVSGYGRGGRPAIMVVVALAGAVSAHAEEVGADARAILKAMSDHLGAQSNIALTFDSAIEVITPELEKIQFTNSGEALLRRPDRLRARRIGGYSDAELVFDGRTVSILGRRLNGYAQFEAPGTVDQLIVALREGRGIALPGADLLLSRPYDVLIADVLEAKHIGHGIVGGVECEHLAFRNFDTDWQIWVRAGGLPIPCKMVITSKTLAGAPQYTVQVKEWTTGIEPAADAFAFVPPPGAERLAPDALVELDELPPDLPTGGNP